MVFSNWICSKSTNNMFVKIVHPGGHVELHDCPILAAEIIYRNPRCVVAYPHVFQQPWAIVHPETLLMLGQKFYVVPVGTIRKLQRHSNRYSPSPLRQTPTSESLKSEEQDPLHTDDSSNSICWFFMKSCAGKGKNLETTDSKRSCFSVKSSDDDDDGDGDGDDSGKRSIRSPSYIISPDHDQLIKGQITRKSSRCHAKLGSPKRRPSFEYSWQPSLESISEIEE